MRPILFLLLTALATAAAPVEVPALELDGRTYETCSITLSDPATARVQHAAGIANLPAEKLPAAILAQLAYDPAAAEQERQRKARDAQEQGIAESMKMLRKGAFLVKVNIFHVAPDGLIGNAYVYDLETRKLKARLDAFIECPTAGTDYAEGLAFEFEARQLGTYKYTNTIDRDRTIPKYVPLKVIEHRLRNPQLQK